VKEGRKVELKFERKTLAIKKGEKTLIFFPSPIKNKTLATKKERPSFYM
jgi:hypothetical protein